MRPISATVVATAAHSVSGAVTPYVLDKDGFFFVADNPFLFIHPEDRYLILADLLFDFLKLPPRGNERRALVRLEDIHPNYDLKLLYRTVDLLKRKNVPFIVSLIPLFVPAGRPESAGIAPTDRRGFIKALHGYTHDVAGTPECAALGSSALRLLVGAGLSAVAWVTPHYAASPEDYSVFGRYFDRIIQRVCYSVAGRGDELVFVSQFFPYTIYKDHYGQFVWPENLGFVAMPGADWGHESPGDIAAAAAAASVVRDSWASFYWHPQLMARKGEAARLEKIIDAVRANGYEFVSLKSLRLKGE